uniref:Uncharacterized protein n=1 Tax=Rhizophora mucronata TaxID=61149 RepID=A0A2P2IHA1_RHIMU
MQPPRLSPTSCGQALPSCLNIHIFSLTFVITIRT